MKKKKSLLLSLLLLYKREIAIWDESKCMGCPAGEMNEKECIKDKEKDCWLTKKRTKY